MKGSVPADKIAEAVLLLRKSSVPVGALLQQEGRLRGLWTENVPLHLAIRRALRPPSGGISPPG